MAVYDELFPYQIEVNSELEEYLEKEGLFWGKNPYIKGSLKIYAKTFKPEANWGAFAKDSDKSIHWHIVGIENEKAPDQYKLIVRGTSLISDGNIKYSNLIPYGHAKIPITPQSPTVSVFQKAEQLRVDALEQIIKKYDL